MPYNWSQICMNSLITIYNFDHENVSQVKEYDFCICYNRWRISKSINVISHRYRCFNIWNILSWKCRSRSFFAIFAMFSFHGKYFNLQKLTNAFCASTNRFRDIDVGWMVCWLILFLLYLVGCLVSWLVSWLFGLVGWFVDWLVG